MVTRKRAEFEGTGWVGAPAQLHVDQMVDVREDNGRIVIEPVLAPVYDLDALIDRMSPDTFPEEVDFGVPVGNEVW